MSIKLSTIRNYIRPPQYGYDNRGRYTVLGRRWRPNCNSQVLRQLWNATTCDDEKFFAWATRIFKAEVDYCHECDGPEFVGNFRETNREERACTDCINSHYMYSDVEHRYIHEDDWDPRQHDEDFEDDESQILPYNADPMAYYKGFLTSKTDPKKPLFLGVELEVEVDGYDKGDLAYSVRSVIPNFVITKEDGSLDDGFEIVTVPATLNVHRERWEPFFSAGFKSDLRSGTTRTCGMHVHIDRKYLTPLTLGKMIVFYNMSANMTLLTKVAQRSINTHSQWCKQHPNKKITSNRNEIFKYSALNTSKPKTVEVRIFKGTLRKDRFFKNMEFVVASIEFCKQAPAREDALTQERFISWLKQPGNRLVYPNLYAFLVEKGMIAARPKPQRVAA